MEQASYPHQNTLSLIFEGNSKIGSISLITENVPSKNKQEKVLYMKDVQFDCSFLGSQAPKQLLKEEAEIT